MADRLVVRGAREHNLQDVSLDLPRDRLIVFTGLSGSGKSSLAFDTIYAEGPAPLRGVAVRLRPSIPRADGQARRRLHRGALAGHLHRPEVGVAESALDRGHGDRGLRLPPAALRPHRQAPLPQLRPAGGPPEPPADRRPDPGHGRGHPVHGPGPGGPGPQGRVRRPARRPGQAGVRPGPGGRGHGRAGRPVRARPGPLRAAHHRGGGRPPDPAQRHPPEADRVVGDGALAGRRGGRGGGGRRRRHRGGGHHLQPAPGLHPLRPQLRGPLPAELLVQLPLRRLPGLYRSGYPVRGRPRAGGARSHQVVGRRGPRPVVGGPQRVLQPDDRRRGRPGRVLARRPVGEAAQGGPEADPLRGRDQAGPPPVPEPLRPPAVLPHPLRGHRALAAAPPHRGGVGVPARQPRGLPARGALSRVRRGPAPARVVGRHRRRVQHLRAVLPPHRQGGRRGGRPRPVRPRPPDRRPGLPRGPRADAVPARRGARLPDPGPLGGHPVGRRGPADPAGQPDRQRAGRGPLRPRRAVHRPPPARQPAADRHAEAPPRPGQHGHRGRARRGDHPGGRPRGRRRARGRGSTAGASCTRVRSPGRAGSSPTRTR